MDGISIKLLCIYYLSGHLMVSIISGVTRETGYKKRSGGWCLGYQNQVQNEFITSEVINTWPLQSALRLPVFPGYSFARTSVIGTTMQRETPLSLLLESLAPVSKHWTTHLIG